MLNYITLNISNKEIQTDVNRERDERSKKIYLLLLTSSIINCIIQFYVFFTSQAELHIMVH